MGDHKVKRAELLTAAISVIAQEGYAAASMRRVAKNAKCTTGTVTYYFDNKQAMVTAVAQYLFDEFDALLDARQEQIDIRAIAQDWLDWTNTHTEDSWLALFQLLAAARHQPAISAIFRRRYARFRKVLASILEKGQRQGIIRKDIPADLLADQLSAMSDGWMMTFPIEPDRFKPSRVRKLLDAVVTLICPQADAVI